MSFTLSKIIQLKVDPTMTRESKLQRFLRTLKKEGQIISEVYSEIYPTSSQPASIYGLPKMHRARAPGSAPPFRSIVSMISTHNYKLVKFLCSLLVPYTFSFVTEITNISTHGKFMVSYDVESLFTNIPLGESIDLAVHYIVEGNPILN